LKRRRHALLISATTDYLRLVPDPHDANRPDDAANAVHWPVCSSRMLTRSGFAGSGPQPGHRHRAISVASLGLGVYPMNDAHDGCGH
jgi:hypothetical protein